VNEVLDERQGVPSASDGGPLEECHGKHHMEKGLADETSEAANEGNRVHEWLYEEKIELSDEEMMLAKECEVQRNMLMDITFNDRHNVSPLILKEQRLWYRNNRYSGKPDFVAIRGGVCLLVDYKCGRITVPHAKENAQLRWTVPLIASKYKVNSVTVAIVQPRCGRPTLHTYDEAGIKACRSKVVSTLRKVEGDNPRLKPGLGCRYCKAKAICPALSEKQDAIARVEDVLALTPVQMSEFLPVIKAVEERCKAIKDRARDMLSEDESAIPGYRLKPGNIERRVGDQVTAFNRLENELGGGFDIEMYLKCCNVSVTKLQKQLAVAGEMGPTEAKRLLNTVLGDAITERQKSSTVAKEK
tara:strand:+ start:466 stop:1539 length:1074 start_codon:yes stop_codon:yes gene_type:complete